MNVQALRATDPASLPASAELGHSVAQIGTRKGVALNLPVPAAAAAVTRVAANAANVQLIAANTARTGLLISNNSATAILYVKYGANAGLGAGTESFTQQIPALGNFVMPQPIYNGQIDGIWSAADAAGEALITELT